MNGVFKTVGDVINELDRIIKVRDCIEQGYADQGDSTMMSLNKNTINNIDDLLSTYMDVLRCMKLDHEGVRL